MNWKQTEERVARLTLSPNLARSPCSKFEQQLIIPLRGVSAALSASSEASLPFVLQTIVVKSAI